MSGSLWPHGLYSPRDSPGQNTGVGSHSLLQGIFPIQGSNPRLSHCRRILYQLSHKGSPRILEWVVILSSRRSSWPRDQTHVSYVSCTVGRFFTIEPPALPFSRGSFQSRDQTQVSYIAGWFFTLWATGSLLLLLLLSRFSHAQICVTPWTIQSKGFSRPEYWSG